MKPRRLRTDAARAGRHQRRPQQDHGIRRHRDRAEFFSFSPRGGLCHWLFNFFGFCLVAGRCSVQQPCRKNGMARSTWSTNPRGITRAARVTLNHPPPPSPTSPYLPHPLPTSCLLHPPPPLLCLHQFPYNANLRTFRASMTRHRELLRSLVRARRLHSRIQRGARWACSQQPHEG